MLLWPCWLKQKSNHLPFSAYVTFNLKGFFSGTSWPTENISFNLAMCVTWIKPPSRGAGWVGWGGFRTFYSATIFANTDDGRQHLGSPPPPLQLVWTVLFPQRHACKLDVELRHDMPQLTGQKPSRAGQERDGNVRELNVLCTKRRRCRSDFLLTRVWPASELGACATCQESLINHCTTITTCTLVSIYQ